MSICRGSSKVAGGALLDSQARDELFVEMLRAYRRSGGLAREAEILDRTAERGCPGWRMYLESRAIVCFEWEQRFWLPWFQFDPANMTLRPGPARVIAELSPILDGWGMASWFATANLWLGDARPVDLIDDSLESVVGAARAYRFVVTG